MRIWNVLATVFFALILGVGAAHAAGTVMEPLVQYSTGNAVEVWKSYAAICTLALGGMLSHYVKRWLMREIPGSLINYLFIDDPRRTGLALFTLIAAVGTAIAMGQFDGVTFKQLFLPAWLLGYASDTLNKGATPAPELK